MPWDEDNDTAVYKVVVNHEKQYSIWPAERDNPLGWRDAGKCGTKSECLTYIAEVWTDMRPLSLRRSMAEGAAQRAAATPATPPPGPVPAAPTMPAGDDLVRRLSTGVHPVEVGLLAEKNARALQECIDRDFVYIKFTQTRGGTALGVRLDRSASDLSRADFTRQTGQVHLVGSLTLNYVKVRCLADIDLATLTGQGHLEPIEA